MFLINNIFGNWYLTLGPIHKSKCGIKSQAKLAEEKSQSLTLRIEVTHLSVRSEGLDLILDDLEPRFTTLVAHLRHLNLEIYYNIYKL